MAIMEATGLKKQYANADELALKGVDFHINEGEILGLLGPNGAGKTTAISIICTLLRCDAGAVSIMGIDALKKAAQVKPLIGLVPQEIALYPSLTARENLNYFGRIYGLSGAKLKQRIDECLELMCLTEQADKTIANFSGGMKRRANLAVGILHAPKLLFLDEPTVGIDAQSRNMILENLRSLCDSGMSMLYTSHYMEEVQQICDRICIIDYGTIISHGTKDALTADHPDCGNLEEIFLKLTGHKLRD